LQHMSWYAVFDLIDGIGTTEEHGLFWDQDLNKPKLAYFAYYTMTRELAQARYLRPFQPTNAAGYVFRMSGGREKTVVWATAATANVAFPYPCLRRVGFESEQAAIYDGDLIWDQDKFANGQIVLRTEQNTPLYVEPCH